MIATQYYNSISKKPVGAKNFVTINILDWNESNKWHEFSPYFLKTDGKEEQCNLGGLLFENFWQGSKVYKTTQHPVEVYASKFQHGNPEHLWYTSTRAYNCVQEDGEMDYDEYFTWRNDIWECVKPVRYPNGFGGRNNVLFTLLQHEDGSEERLGYIESRKRIYIKEYSRLVRKLPLYKKLLKMLHNGKNLLLAEVDVPGKYKRFPFNRSDENNVCFLSPEYIEKLIHSTACPLGHGIVLAKCLFEDFPRATIPKLMPHYQRVQNGNGIKPSGFDRQKRGFTGKRVRFEKKEDKSAPAQFPSDEPFDYS